MLSKLICLKNGDGEFGALWPLLFGCFLGTAVAMFVVLATSGVRLWFMRPHFEHKAFKVGKRSSRLLTGRDRMLVYLAYRRNLLPANCGLAERNTWHLNKDKAFEDAKRQVRGTMLEFYGLS